MDSEIKEINLEDTVPFKYHSGLTYEGIRLQHLMDSIERQGLLNPIIVRPTDSGKYEIICGHNRAKATKALGHNMITADIRHGLSDAEAERLFYDHNLNLQIFHDGDRNFYKRLGAIKYCEKLIRENSRQGKRTDLETEAITDTDSEAACAQNRQKLKKTHKRTTIRDEISKQLGISTAAFSKYRRIIKLPNDYFQLIARLLDETRIDFQEAYLISNLIDFDMKILLGAIEKDPKVIIDKNALSELPTRKDEASDIIFPRTRKRALKVLTHHQSSDMITRTRNRKKLC